jgi:hypothetical protein
MLVSFRKAELPLLALVASMKAAVPLLTLEQRDEAWLILVPSVAWNELW